MATAVCPAVPIPSFFLSPSRRLEAAGGGKCGGRRAVLAEALPGRGGHLGREEAGQEAFGGGGRAYEAGWRVGARLLWRRRAEGAAIEQPTSQVVVSRNLNPIERRRHSDQDTTQIGKKSMVSLT